MNPKTKHRGKLLTVFVLLCLSVLSVLNLKLIKAPLTNLVKGEIGFTGFVEQVQKKYTSDRFVTKSYFVDLNGLFAKLTGRRLLNDVVRCENGQLARTAEKLDMTELSENLSEFSEYLSSCEDIPFLYVQIPCKENADGLLPQGAITYAQENTDELLADLEAKDVKILDLRSKLTQTPEQIDQFYYKTDHHWNSDGALVAFHEIVSVLSEIAPDANIDLEYTLPQQWERHIKENWYLGSLGKRVGTLFGGTDPLIWYTPQFETEMSCIIPKHKQLFSGDFSKANIRSEYIDKKDYFAYNAYCVYIGGDYPLVQHRNLQAPSKLRLLILKDSFMLPLQSYLSTVFQEIDVIDPRHFTDCTLVEYVQWSQPDIVIMAINPSQFGSSAYKRFGVEQAYIAQSDEKNYEAVDRCDIEIAASDSNHNYKRIQLESSSTYKVRFDEISILTGKPDGVSVMLYDATTKKLLSSTLFDLAYCNSVGEYVWTFKTPQTEDDLQLLFYAGIHGSTAGNSVIYHNVLLERCI